MTFSLHGNFSDRNFLGVELNKRSCHIQWEEGGAEGRQLAKRACLPQGLALDAPFTLK